MTTETRKRIEAYKKALPDLRERVIAVALLFAMSLVMLTSASFAWLTISRRPAVTGVNTSVAANGNLEIALATSTDAPDESKVGDSSAAEGQSVAAANITWGNLVNLSDPSYGLEGMTLRPAWLNESSLLVSPLYGAVYEGDGRVSKLNSSFAYTIWNADSERFMVTDGVDTFGVRAISSTKAEVVQGNEEAVKRYEMKEAVMSANLAAGSAYSVITDKNNPKGYMDSLANIMGVFMTAQVNAGQGDESLTNPSMDQADVQNLRDIFADMIEVYDLQFAAWAELANYKIYLQTDGKSSGDKTAEYMKTATKAKLTDEGLLFQGWEQATKDYAKLEDGLAKLEALSAQGDIKWADSGLNEIVSSLMNVGTCTVDGTPVNNIGVGKALDYINGVHEAKITNGVLYNFEKINGAKCYVAKMKVTAKAKRMGMTIPATITANISTTAEAPYYFATDLAEVQKLNTGSVKQVANDTYGLAIDLWVRTNAAGSYLTLEGNVLTKSEYKEVTGKDANGNPVDIYTFTRTDTAEEGSTEPTVEGSTEPTESTETGTITYTMDVYKVVTKEDDGTETTTWHNATSHGVVELREGENPVRKTEEIITVIGFEGENRIWEDAKAWEDNAMLSLDSTTQGSGSCYVYYADSPEDQARSLNLLNSMKVAFIDANGALLATASMDTTRYFAESGRVTVPLTLDTDSLEIGTDNAGNPIYGITALTQNVPMRITAIVYLDGTKLTNQEVLAASDIQGKLNIQFGSSTTLSHAEDETLYSATRTVRASVSNTSFKYDESLASGTPMTTTVTVNVDGDAPSTVTAFFVRAISSTQGTREKTMTFTKQDDGSWKADHTFTAPGSYILRSVELDGQNYDLATCPTVEIEGFGIRSLEQDKGVNASVMTANSSYSVTLKLAFASDDVKAMPTTVQGRYIRDEDGSAVNVNFTYNSSGPDKGYWTGTATFISSGSYTLQYLVLDGVYTELDPGLWRTATVTLGMKVAVYTDSPQSFKYVPAELTDHQKNLYMKVKVMDNGGEPLQGLSGVHLYYGKQGSTSGGLDAPLTWNPSTQYYEGQFQSTVGTYVFQSVEVSGNTITNATTSPTFRIMSPEPPEYYGHGTIAYQYKPNPASDPAVMNVQITNSSAAQVQAYIIKDGAAEGTWVTGVIGGELTTTDGKTANNWNFTVPGDANDWQDGNWKLTQLKIWDAYAADGTEYTEEAPLEIDVSDTDNVTKAINQVFVTFAAGQSQNYSGTFMQSHTISGLNVDIKDFEDQPLSATDVKLTFTYVNQSSEQYGGYASDQLTNATTGATITVALDTNSGTNYAQSNPATILYAGSYSTEFSFTSGGKTYTYSGKDLPANAPVFTVSSKAPTVKITEVSPASTTTEYRYYLSNPVTTESIDLLRVTGTLNRRVDDYNAAVYIYCFTDDSGRDGQMMIPHLPTVDLELSGVPSNIQSATITFGNEANSQYAKTLSFNNLKVNDAEIGGKTNGAYRNNYSYTITTYPGVYPAGKQTATQITIGYKDISFKVDLSHAVTIDQPMSPPYVDYSISNSTYTGNVPGRVYSNSGETYTITLPSASDITTTWTETISSEKRTNLQTVSNTNVEYYETWTSGCDDMYQKYTKYTKVTTEDVALTSYTRTWKITGWRVGNQTYGLGESITVTGNQTITAVMTHSDGASTTTDHVVTTTTKYFTTGSDTKGTPPSGYTNVTSDPDNGNKDNWTQSSPNAVESWNPPKP